MTAEALPRVLLPRAYWTDEAACVGADLSLFYGSEDVPLIGAATLPGRRLCAICPVARDCMLEALTMNERMGLRAGFLGHERTHTLNRHGGDVAAAMADYDAGVFYTPDRRPR